MTSSSPNGVPPSSSARATSLPTLRVVSSGRPAALAGKVPDLEPIARHLEASVVEQHAVLERLVDVEPDLGLRVQIELRAQRLDGDWFT